MLWKDLTADTPQVKPLTMKTDATQTQPYPPSGGGSAARADSLNGNATVRASSTLGSEGLFISSALLGMDVTGVQIDARRERSSITSRHNLQQ